MESKSSAFAAGYRSRERHYGCSSHGGGCSPWRSRPI